jgi:hypothetical protein
MTTPTEVKLAPGEPEVTAALSRREPTPAVMIIKRILADLEKP